MLMKTILIYGSAGVNRGLVALAEDGFRKVSVLKISVREKEELAQWVVGLPSEHEDLSLNPQYHSIKK